LALEKNTALTAGIYSDPIRMSTHSGYIDDDHTTAKAVLYDYNNACGYFAMAPAPT